MIPCDTPTKGVHIIDIQGRFVWVDAHYCEMVKYSKDKLLKMHVFDIDLIYTLEDVPTFAQAIERHLNIMTKFRCADGSIVPTEVVVTPFIIEGATYFYCVAKDVAIDRHLWEEVAPFLFDHSKEAVAITSLEGKFLAVNPAFEAMFGYSKTDIIGHTPLLLRSNMHQPKFYQVLKEAIQNCGSWEGEIVDKQKNGTYITKYLTIKTLYDDHNIPQKRIAVFSEISYARDMMHTLWRQANFDTLTGLPNRHMLIKEIENEITKSTTMQKSFSLFYMDLDYFKEINDTYGHDMGDEVLKMAALRLSSSIRQQDVLGRLSGDEFIALVSAESEHLIKIAQHLIKSLSEPFHIYESTLHISASIGIVKYPHDGVSVSELISNADKAMYISKQKGRNQYTFFDASMRN